MTRRYISEVFRRVLVPVVHGCDFYSSLAFAQLVTREPYITLAGFVGPPGEESLSRSTVAARELRQELRECSNRSTLRVRSRVRVSYHPWDEVVALVEEEKSDLMILDWPCQFEALKIRPAEALANPPCDVALVCKKIPSQPKRVLVPIRGGPYAELALRISLAISHLTQAEVTCLHLTPGGAGSSQDAAFRGIHRVLASLEDVEHVLLPTQHPVEAILENARQYDLVILGASARPDHAGVSIGSVAERLLNENLSGLVVVKTRRPSPVNFDRETVGQTAISVLVDKWFAENTYHSDEFTNLELLYDLKTRQKLSISLALPALNEEETVGNVLQTLKGALKDRIPLLDEVVLVDSNSTDATREIAADLGIPVFIHQQTLPQYGTHEGKGEALWKSLYLTRGDILIWIDTDIINIDPSFVLGLLGPLLFRPNIQFVKGFYRRPLKVGNAWQAGGGGRVTELTARPLLNLFYPELSGVVQPLAGEYGGRRSALERLPFYSGYGVEIGLLIGVLEHFGLNALAQVDLQERIHRNQSLEALSKMSFAIIQTVMRKLEGRFGASILEEVNQTMKLIRYEPRRLFLEIEEIIEHERPPMIELPEYLARHEADK